MSKPRYAWWNYARKCLEWRRREEWRLSEREKGAVDAALRDIDRLPDARERRMVVDGVLIRGELTLDGAAIRASIGYITARRYQAHAFKQVAYHLGLLETGERILRSAQNDTVGAGGSASESCGISVSEAARVLRAARSERDGGRVLRFAQNDRAGGTGCTGGAGRRKTEGEEEHRRAQPQPGQIAIWDES